MAKEMITGLCVGVLLHIHLSLLTKNPKHPMSDCFNLYLKICKEYQNARVFWAEDMNRYFSNMVFRGSQTHEKKVNTQVIRKMQSKPQ